MDQNPADKLRELAEAYAEMDDSKTADEWLAWLKEILIGDVPPIVRYG